MTKKPRKVALPGAPPFYAIKSVDALKADRVNPPETDARVQAILEILKRDFSEPIRVAGAGSRIWVKCFETPAPLPPAYRPNNQRHGQANPPR